MPEEFSKNVIVAEIRENIALCILFFKDGLGLFLLLSNVSDGLVIWLVKENTQEAHLHRLRALLVLEGTAGKDINQTVLLQRACLASLKELNQFK